LIILSPYVLLKEFAGQLYKSRAGFRCFAISLTFSLISIAVNAQTFFGAGAEALGRAGRAANIAIEDHFLNPAGLAFSQSINMGVAFQESDISLSTPTNSYNVIITNNNPEEFAAGGLAFVTNRFSYTDRIVNDQDISLDIAFHLAPTISFGVQEHRLWRTDNAGNSYTKYNTTVGFLALPRSWFGIALVAYDLFGDTDNVLNPAIALGTNLIIMDLVHFRMDLVRPTQQNPTGNGSLNVGAEFDLNYGFMLRAGALWDGIANTRFWTGGVGWDGPNLSLAYAYRSNIDSTNDVTETFQASTHF